MHMLTSFSEDKILLPWYVNWFVWIPFQNICIQTKIWTQIVMSISNNNNYYTKSASTSTPL